MRFESNIIIVNSALIVVVYNTYDAYQVSIFVVKVLHQGLCVIAFIRIGDEV